MDTPHFHQNVTRLEKLANDPQVALMNKADKLTLVAFVLHRNDPDGFKQLDNLTWPEGHAILLASNREQMARTNRTAQIKEIPNTSYVIDTGHDNAAMRRLIDLMMRKLGYEPGIINRIKNLFEVEQPFRLNDLFT